MGIKKVAMGIKKVAKGIKKVAKAKAPLPYSLIFFQDESLQTT